MTSPLEQILEPLQDVRKNGNGYMARCPCHNDQHPSLSVGRGDDGRVLLKCHAGCETRAIVAKIGLRMADLFPSDNGGQANSRRFVVANYTYTDAEGKPLRRKLRYEPKDFSWQHPDPQGNWITGAGTGPKVLYNLQKLVSRLGELVFVVEGEKDADSLMRLGLLAVSSPDGASHCRVGKKWQAEYTECLRNRDVIIIEDNDREGRNLARHIASCCHEVSNSVRLLCMPVGKDVSDWLAAGGNKDELLKMAHESPMWTPNDRTAEADEAVNTLPLTDTGNAERLVRLHGADLRYLRYGRSDSGHWLNWTGMHWAPNSGAVWQFAKSTARALYEEANQEEELDRRQAAAKWAAKSEAEQRIKSMIALARSEPAVSITPADLDTDPWLLNVLNGTIDLRKGALREHRREDHITKLCQVLYDPAAEAPRFMQFLDEIMPGMEAVKSFLQRLAGYFLTGDIRNHILPVFYGPGRNGKNTFIDCIMGILGEYAAPAPPYLLTARRSDEHPTEIADAKGKRLLVASETEEGRHLRVSLVKQLTGDAYLKGRFMRQDYFTFARTHKIVLLTNNKPQIRERSLAIWSRIVLVPFSVSFAGREDFTLHEQLRREWPGILAWAVRGCLAWQSDGLQIPPEVQAATAEYEKDQDALSPFLEECCILDPQARVSRAEIWECYLEWAKRSGERPLPRNALYQRLRQQGLKDTRFRERGAVANGFSGAGIIHKPSSV